MTDPPQTPPGSGPPEQPERPGPPRRAFDWRTLGVSVLVNAVAPLILYDQLQHRVGSATTALVAAAGIPLLWTTGRLILRRRPDPVGLLALAGFVLGIALVLLTGGNPFVFKIREAVLTGALGLIGLGSIVARHPIALLALRRAQADAPEAALRHAAFWITLIAGVTLVVQATVIILLAAVLPTATFLAVHQLVGLGILAAGVFALTQRKRLRPAPSAGDHREDHSWPPGPDRRA